MTRKNKLFLNVSSSLVHQVVTIVCGLILPRAFISYFGSEINGLVASITQFISIIAFLELGIGAVVQASLYKPLAKKSYDEISAIISSSNRFFRNLAKFLLIYILVLIFIYPIFINSSYDFYFTSSLILILAMSSFVQYFFSISYQLLLNADQLAFIPLITNTGLTIANTILVIVLIRLNYSLHVVKLVSAIIFLIKPILFQIIVRKKYKLNLKIRYETEPIKQKWNGIAQHIAAVVLSSTDIIVLSVFSSLSAVSVYSIYYMIVNGIKQIVLSSTTGTLSLFGNMLANNENEKLKQIFTKYVWFKHNLVVMLFTITGILIIPFITVYTAVIDDYNYIYPTFGVLLTLSQALYCLRLPYNQIVLAAGHFKQTQNSAIIEASINIIISIFLVSKFGLIGVAIGTAVAMGYRTIYLAWYLSSNIIYFKISNFFKHLVVDAISVIMMVLMTRTLSLQVSSYIEWIFLAVKVTGICIFVSLIINFIFYPKILLSMRHGIRR
jgi:O-antigen/teichoic acid export membrane protein